MQVVGDAGDDAQAQRLKTQVERAIHLVAGQRPRPDQRHLPQQHVEELRELVQRGAPQDASDARDPRVVAQLPVIIAMIIHWQIRLRFGTGIDVVKYE